MGARGKSARTEAAASSADSVEARSRAPTSRPARRRVTRHGRVRYHHFSRFRASRAGSRYAHRPDVDGIRIHRPAKTGSWRSADRGGSRGVALLGFGLASRRRVAAGGIGGRASRRHRPARVPIDSRRGFARHLGWPEGSRLRRRRATSDPAIQRRGRHAHRQRHRQGSRQRRVRPHPDRVDDVDADGGQREPLRAQDAARVRPGLRSVQRRRRHQPRESPGASAVHDRLRQPAAHRKRVPDGARHAARAHVGRPGVESDRIQLGGTDQPRARRLQDARHHAARSQRREFRRRRRGRQFARVARRRGDEDHRRRDDSGCRRGGHQRREARQDSGVQRHPDQRREGRALRSGCRLRRTGPRRRQPRGRCARRQGPGDDSGRKRRAANPHRQPYRARRPERPLADSRRHRRQGRRRHRRHRAGT